MSTQKRVLSKFGKTLEELKKELKFACCIMSCATARILSFTQILLDIYSTKDGSIRGPKRGPNDPPAVTVITLNPDFYYSSSFPLPRLGPKAEEMMFQAVIKESLGHEAKVENYGKPVPFNYNFVAEQLQERAKRQRVKISNFYMIGDNPESDIAGGNAVGWTTILVKTGLYKDDLPTSKNGNDTRHPATHVVKDFAAAIDKIYELEKLN